MQPIIKDSNNHLRFKKNEIVDYLLHNGSIDLNHLVIHNRFSQEDWEQFYQLIGYSISGYHELNNVSDRSAKLASRRARKLMPKAGGCRDSGCNIHSGVKKEKV